MSVVQTTGWFFKIDVPPYPRLAFVNQGKKSWVGNSEGLRKLRSFYDELGWTWTARTRPAIPLTGPLSVQLVINKRRAGDVDNLAKSVLDAMTRLGIYDDDRQVKELYVKVERGEPSLRIQIKPLEGENHPVG